jgi:hypothetical protein
MQNKAVGGDFHGIILAQIRSESLSLVFMTRLWLDGMGTRARKCENSSGRVSLLARG